MKNLKKIVYITAVAAALLLVTVCIFNTLRSQKLLNGALEDDARGDLSISEDSTDIEVEDGLVRLATDAELGNMDIAKNTDSYYIALNVFERLVDVEQNEDGSSKIVPSLAKEWKVSDDGKKYSFTLKDDACFSDGTPLTAEDVEFSLTRLLTVPDSEQKAFTDMIEGAEELQNGEETALRGIEVIDDSHIDISLKEAFPSFVSMLGSPACSILSKKSVTAAGDSYGTDIRYIIGSGPYIITENSDSFCRMELNPFYKGDEPSVKKAEVRVMVPAVMDREFRKGRLDILDLEYVNPEAVSFYIDNEVYKNRLVAKENVEIISLMLNTKTAPLDNIKVRKAIQYAINRERIINEVYGGYAELTDGIIPKGLMGYNKKLQGWLKYDPVKAKELLKEAGIGQRDVIELAISSTADTALQKFTALIQEDLTAVGLNAVLVVYDKESRLHLRRTGQIMAYQFQWIADYNDPDNFFYTIFGSKDAAERYSSNYADEDTINRIIKARNITDFEKRMAEYST